MPTAIEWGVTGRYFAVIILGKKGNFLIHVDQLNSIKTEK